MLQNGWSRPALGLHTSMTTGNPFSTNPSRVSWENFLWSPSATPEQFHTTCSISFRALLPVATAGREQAMDAGCGLSTPGHWDGPWIRNERAGVSHGIMCHGEIGSMWTCCAITKFGAYSRQHCTSSANSIRFFRLCFGERNCESNIGLWSVPVASLRGVLVKDGAVRLFSRGGGGKVHPPPGFDGFMPAMAIYCVYECVARWNKYKRSTFRTFKHCFNTTIISIIAIRIE